MRSNATGTSIKTIIQSFLFTFPDWIHALKLFFSFINPTLSFPGWKSGAGFCPACFP